MYFCVGCLWHTTVKNPVWFVFYCTNNLQSQPIGLRNIFTDYIFLLPSQPMGLYKIFIDFCIDLLPLKNVSGRSLPNFSLVSRFRMAC